MAIDMKRWATAAGGAVAFGGLAFVGHRLAAEIGAVNIAQFTPIDAAAIGVGCVASAGLAIFLALAWQRIINHLGGVVGTRQAVGIYGVSQIGKYVPGNVFHLAARQALGYQAGIRGTIVAKSALWEVGLIVVVGALFAPLALPGYLGWSVWPGVVLFLILIGLLGAVAGAAFSHRIFAAATYQTAYLVGAGCVFVLAISRVTEFDTIAVPTLIGAYVLSWLAGLITPGAPAGMGVRELVLYGALTGVVEADAIALAVVLGRVISIVGDVLFFLVAAVIARPGRWLAKSAV